MGQEYDNMLLEEESDSEDISVEGITTLASVKLTEMGSDESEAYICEAISPDNDDHWDKLSSIIKTALKEDDYATAGRQIEVGAQVFEMVGEYMRSIISSDWQEVQSRKGLEERYPMEADDPVDHYEENKIRERMDD